MPNISYSTVAHKKQRSFMILDGTINPNLPCADFSKTGIYIRNMEPNIVNLESPYLHMLRGPTDIAKIIISLFILNGDGI